MPEEAQEPRPRVTPQPIEDELHRSYIDYAMSVIVGRALPDVRDGLKPGQRRILHALKEPTVLPSKFPNLLVNGSSGIAVGMATNIPPHNLREVVDALIVLIDNPNVGLIDLYNPETGPIRGPDFPTGGILYGAEGVADAYRDGRGLIRIRARANYEEAGHDRVRIVITEIPYMVSKAALVESIALLVKSKRIDGVTDLRDESDREGMR